MKVFISGYTAYRGDVRHDQVDICVVGEESDPVRVRPREILSLAIDLKELTSCFGEAGDR